MNLERLSRKVIYENPWVNLYVDRVRFPNGNIVEEHHLLDFKNAAAAALVEDGQGRLLFERIPRYPVGSLGWEIPAGGMIPGETPAQAIRREIMEETGYETGEAELLYTYHPMNGIANKVFHILRCRAGERIKGIDPDEICDIAWLTLDEVRGMIRARTLTDGYTLTAFLLYFHLLEDS